MERKIHVLMVLLSCSLLFCCDLINPTHMSVEERFSLYLSVALTLIMGYSIFATIRKLFYDRPIKTLKVTLGNSSITRTMTGKTTSLELTSVKKCQVTQSRRGEVTSIVLHTATTRVGFVHLENMELFWDLLRKKLPKKAVIEKKNVLPTYLFFLMGLLLVIVTEIAEHSNFETIFRSIFCAFLIFTGGFTLFYRPASRFQPEVKMFERWVAAAIVFGAALILFGGSSRPGRELAYSKNQISISPRVK